MADSRPRVKAVVFDIGATLVTGPPVAPNKVIAALMDGVTPAEVASVIMTTNLESAEQVCAALESRFGKVGARAVAGIEELWESQATAPTALEGASETVCALKARRLKIGLLSDIWNPYYAGVEIALPKVVACADSIVLSCRTGSRKPNADNFLQSLAELGVAASEAVMVGDTYEHDILPALKLGMRAIWVLARPDREADSIMQILNGEAPPPTLTVPDIAAVASAEMLS